MNCLWKFFTLLELFAMKVKKKNQEKHSGWDRYSSNHGANFGRQYQKNQMKMTRLCLKSQGENFLH